MDTSKRWMILLLLLAASLQAVASVHVASFAATDAAHTHCGQGNADEPTALEHSCCADAVLGECQAHCAAFVALTATVAAPPQVPEPAHERWSPAPPRDHRDRPPLPPPIL